MQEQSGGNDTEGQGMGKGMELLCPQNTPLPSNLHVFTKQKLPEHRPFGVLWRLHYIATID